MARIIAALLLFVLLPSGAHAQKRLALLIGNQGYATAIGALANPHNDVALLISLSTTEPAFLSRRLRTHCHSA